MSHKGLTNNLALPVEQTEFLEALYHDAAPNLWLELRCIDPTSKQKPKVLWTPVQRRIAKLREANALNRNEGYSVYFAPCLRDKQKGNADAAVMLPALWVDMDCAGDTRQRELALNKLEVFSPLPSAIYDSGGGWHAYWLLSEPFHMRELAQRERAATLLKGLCAALGGDAQYVKSVASIMRLPGTVNTKPDRGGAICTKLKLDTTLRYDLSTFEWLSVPDSVTVVVSTSRDNGHAPLPNRTTTYLATGAANGMRNNELFAAACQLRDAGYSQNEAEATLISRYLVDGSGDNASAREREARGTIASAYRQSARDAIPDPRNQVTALVSRYTRPVGQTDRPAAEQMAEAVRACASLDALAWAVERKRLRSICGGDFTAADLDRLYRQARQDAKRGQFADSTSADVYAEEAGCILFERRTERGTHRQRVAGWSARVSEWVTRVHDDEQHDHVMRLELRHPQHHTTLDVPSELFGDANALQRFIATKAGGHFAVEAGMGKRLIPAILALSGTYPRRTAYNFMGWTKLDGKLIYIAPGVSIGATGPLASSPAVELEPRLRDYSLSWTDAAVWPQMLDAFAAAAAVFPPQLAPTCLAFALLPLVQQFFPPAAPRPALHLVGTYQSGKSELSALMTSFYGNFSRDEPPAQWGDTVNAVETLGYQLANALYWVDDYKTMYADERTFTRFLQSYSRGMGRGRLTREARLRPERPCRGLLLSTGETMLEGEASVLSRLLTLEVPPWEQRDPGGKVLAHAHQLRHLLPGFTARFAVWVAQQVEAGDFEKRIEREFATSVEGYRAKLSTLPGSQANTGRVIQNWAVLVTAYRLLREFLRNDEADILLPTWQDALNHTLQTVRQERASDLFLNMVGQLVGGGQVLIDNDLHTPQAPTPGLPTIGYRDGEYVFLLPDVALQAVNRVHPLHFTASAIAAQLHEDGWLLSGNTTDRLTVQVRVRGSRIWMWRLKAGALGGEEG